ncbi:MAG TPA: DUF3667 domain-containing protein [Ferruginibacter sp.]|nr:DUF3667 domain-containing protein [Ferruginibacter sp.]
MDTLNCKNCGHSFSGKFCNNCGEKVYTEKDKSVRHLFGEALHFVTHFEGNFFNTLKSIFTKPGQLSVDYCNGIRKKYFKPLSFFLLLVIIYLLFPVFEGLNMKLRFHETHGLYGKYAKAEVQRIMAERHITEQQLADIFHHAGERISKFLMFILIPIIAVASRLFAYKKRRPYYDHFILSIELLSFFLLWGFMLVPILFTLLYWIFGIRIASEEITSIFIFSVFLFYISLAARRFFKVSWGFAIFYAIIFSISLIILLEYIYKPILFYIAIRMV